MATDHHTSQRRIGPSRRDRVTRKHSDGALVADVPLAAPHLSGPTPLPLAQQSHPELYTLPILVVDEADIGPDDLSDHPPDEQPRDGLGEVF